MNRSLEYNSVGRVQFYPVLKLEEQYQTANLSTSVIDIRLLK